MYPAVGVPNEAAHHHMGSFYSLSIKFNQMGENAFGWFRLGHVNARDFGFGGVVRIDINVRDVAGLVGITHGFHQRV